MIGRGIWIFAILVAAALTIQLQLDREGIKRPELRALVAEPLRAASQPYFAEAALTGTDAARALVEARKLVLRRPVPAEHLTIMAAAQAKAGQAEAAIATLQTAGDRGWRDPLAQEARLRLALELNDEAEAARRYMALMLRRETSRELLTELGAQVFAEPDGVAHRTMIALISGADRWPNVFLRRGLQVMPPDAFAQITAGSIASGVDFGCPSLMQVAAAISRTDSAAGALIREAGKAQCPALAKT